MEDKISVKIGNLLLKTEELTAMHLYSDIKWQDFLQTVLT